MAQRLLQWSLLPCACIYVSQARRIIPASLAARETDQAAVSVSNALNASGGQSNASNASGRGGALGTSAWQCFSPKSMGCTGTPQSGWCGEKKANCEGSCNGIACIDGKPATPGSTPTPPSTTPSSPTPSSTTPVSTTPTPPTPTPPTPTPPTPPSSALAASGGACAPQDFDCYTKTPQSTAGWTFNNVVSGDSAQQQLFCKMQVPTTSSRSTTNGPLILVDGYVAAGIGLSNNQFGEGTFGGASYAAGQLSCGMCMTATIPANSTQGFQNMNCELTAQESGTSKQLTVMVMDQCKDDKCVASNSWLDFDTYGAAADQYIYDDLTWTAVECPVDQGNISITLAFNQYARQDKFVLVGFDMRVPIKKVEYKCTTSASWTDMPFTVSIGYAAWYSGCGDSDLISFRMTSVYDDTVSYTMTESLPNVPAADATGDQQYQYLVRTNVQFPSKSATPAPALYPSMGSGGSCS